MGSSCGYESIAIQGSHDFFLLLLLTKERTKPCCVKFQTLKRLRPPWFPRAVSVYGFSVSNWPPYGPTSGLAIRVEVGYQGLSWALSLEKCPELWTHNEPDSAIRAILGSSVVVLSNEDTCTPMVAS